MHHIIKHASVKKNNIYRYIYGDDGICIELPLCVLVFTLDIYNDHYTV